MTRRKPALRPLVWLATFLVVCACGIIVGTAQGPPPGEREFEDKIPAHLPIKVKVKNIEKVKDLKNEHWGRDLEIEVRNTGTKPIYYLRLSLYFVDVKPDSAGFYGWPLRYGRPELVDINNRARPEDIPIQPGETYLFKVPAGMITGWEKYRANRNLPHPKKVGLQFEVLNYGDGTGFSGTGGEPMPN
ncbi:MAG TPA: hypothetical protein VF546_07660 [Pyrinomonadaceae bacterium]|jgi:hypothetical protein